MHFFCQIIAGLDSSTFYRGQVPIVLQHDIPVQRSLPRRQTIPFRLGEVHSHVLKGHRLLGPNRWDHGCCHLVSLSRKDWSCRAAAGQETCDVTSSRFAPARSYPSVK